MNPKLVEEVARAIWEQRVEYAAKHFGHALEKYGDGSIPHQNGCDLEAQAAIRACMARAAEIVATEPAEAFMSPSYINQRTANRKTYVDAIKREGGLT